MAGRLSASRVPPGRSRYYSVVHKGRALISRILGVYLRAVEAERKLKEQEESIGPAHTSGAVAD